jgi:hypothetical protein
MENRYYRIIASPYLLNIDYNDLYQAGIEDTRFSISGEWAIITYINLPENPDFPYYTNEEIIQFIYNNWDEWNENPLGSNPEPI